MQYKNVFAYLLNPDHKIQFPLIYFDPNQVSSNFISAKVERLTRKNNVIIINTSVLNLLELFP